MWIMVCFLFSRERRPFSKAFALSPTFLLSHGLAECLLSASEVSARMVVDLTQKAHHGLPPFFSAFWGILNDALFCGCHLSALVCNPQHFPFSHRGRNVHYPSPVTGMAPWVELSHVRQCFFTIFFCFLVWLLPLLLSCIFLVHVVFPRVTCLPYVALVLFAFSLSLLFLFLVSSAIPTCNLLCFSFQTLWCVPLTSVYMIGKLMCVDYHFP